MVSLFHPFMATVGSNDISIQRRMRMITQGFHQNPIASSFAVPISTEKKKLAEYQVKIKHPMDLGVVRKKLKDNAYPGLQAWIDDMNLIFDNAIEYNGRMSLIGGIAAHLKRKFAKEVRGIMMLNPINYENRLILLVKELKEAVAATPPSFSLTVPETKAYPEFTVESMTQLMKRASQLSTAGHQSEILEALEREDTISPLTIDLANLSRAQLIKLYELCEKYSSE